MKKIDIIFVLLFALALACTKPYDFDATAFEKILVIEGRLTNDPNDIGVLISYNYALDTVINQYISSAQVWVEDENGTRTDFTPNQNGRYLPPAGFAGIAGKSYQLFIDYENQLYTSTKEVLNASPAIDSIYHRYAELPASNNEQNVGGIQFFVDSHDETGSQNFFRFEWRDTYIIKPPYPEIYYVDPADTTLYSITDPITECFKSGQSNQLYYTSTVGSIENRVSEFPIRYIDEDNAKPLEFRYSLLVRQYAITEDSYLFYKRLDENNKYGGSLFDKQTGAVFGNIRAVGNENEQVLGYFEVSGISEKREFFNMNDYDDRINIISSFRNCNDYLFNVDSAVDVLQLIDSVRLPVYIYNYTTDVIDIPPYYIQLNRICSDCAYYADTLKPAFWID